MLAAPNNARWKWAAVEKVNENAYDISSIKLRSFWKFHVVVVQKNGKEMYKQSVLHVQSCIFAN